MKYYANGKPVTLPADTEDHDEAVTFLRRKMADAAEQRITDLPERVTMNQLFDLLLEWYRVRERRTTYDLECLIRRADDERQKPGALRAWFGKMKAQAVTSAAIARYVAARRSEEPRPANGTINRALAYVRRAMKLGAQQDPPLVLRVPHFDMLPAAEPREGTLPHEKYKAVRDLLPSYARVALVISYHTGARRGEITKIRKEKIDFNAGRINLPGRTTKNKRPRFLPIYGDMAVEIQLAIDGGKPECPLLIQRDGKPVQDWEKAWATACEATGVKGTLFHDLRRTALTNMIEAGLSEKEAMEISGHRTRAVFDRYHIVSERRLKEMAGKLDAHLKSKDSPEQKGAIN
ncbi:MAG TPA: site-specific integrase [Bryobacteraceae bacterium]|nr:site-specific integrase [Bryobacteraceae bacterium]